MYLAPSGPGLPSRGGVASADDEAQDCRAEPSLAASPAREEAEGLNGAAPDDDGNAGPPQLPVA